MSEYVFRTDEPIGGCAKCPMRHRQGSAWCQYLLKWTPTNEEIERREDCPLVELPPHGDLIDSSKLLTTPITDYKLEGHLVIEIEDIENAPTILEASK